MANWDQIDASGNVEDRRSGGGAMAVGGAGILGLIVLLLNIFGGNNPTTKFVSSVLTQLQQTQVQTQQVPSGTFNDPSNFKQFASKVVGSNNQMWTKFLSDNGKTYNEPRLVLFRGVTRSGCGVATSDVGPHYCSEDTTVYLDETFFEELSSRFGAKGGDVAQGYVIAHEIGHHVQNELGIFEYADSLQQRNPDQANQISEMIELQADCFAGVWSHAVQAQGVVTPTEIAQASDAAAAVGDDRIQKSTQGYTDAETWTHGSSAQRVRWFSAGYNSGQPSKCDTFSASNL